MSQWPSIKAKRLLAALFGIGWKLKRQSGSHRTLSREGWPDVVFAFHDGEEIGPLANLELLKDPETNFVVIMKDGKLFKNSAR
jgi:predicted RNA binding protein YcfA (HicA-like mRNA interferase family)